MRESMVRSSLLRHRKLLSWMFARNLIFVERLGYMSLALWRTCLDSSVLIAKYSSLLLFSPSLSFLLAFPFFFLCGMLTLRASPRSLQRRQEAQGLLPKNFTSPF